MLHAAALESEVSSWRWRGRSDVELAIDESGLWVIYAALDDEDLLQEVMKPSKPTRPEHAEKPHGGQD
ncbi:Olfactomedin-like protein 2B [Bagarius yarrelli]|uniref:Olfactomedin-like protein 2B n=1 Tax=Bagarius yarrelli TaxID=175774 RepID=A0A556V651_BAGYA|nr:Olfactomedin-like protein 2B [Bagarius yarrelli]